MIKMRKFHSVCCLALLWGNCGYAMGVDSLGIVADSWEVVREFPQKSFSHTVPAGNYSGITHLHNDIYAVVSDKSDSALYFNFRIQVNPATGELVNVENLGGAQRIDAVRPWYKGRTGFDHESIAKVTDSTLVVASEGNCALLEYPILPDSMVKGKDAHFKEENLQASQRLRFWGEEWNPTEFYPNYNFESLAYDSVTHYLWTVPESTMRRDGVPATPENGLENKLRLLAYYWESNREDSAMTSVAEKMKIDFTYLMDKPSTRKKAETYAMGVSELCVLPDGQLLVLEREAFVPKIKMGAFCRCKLYLINPFKEEGKMNGDEMHRDASLVRKQLLTEWKTGLSLFDRSFANYEGMCLGPKLEDGSHVLILLSDSQNQYAGILKDWFKTIVIGKNGMSLDR